MEEIGYTKVKGGGQSLPPAGNWREGLKRHRRAKIKTPPAGNWQERLIVSFGEVFIDALKR